MGCCRENKLKYNCGTKTNARCVFYEGYLPKYSELLEEDCVTIEETTEELYKNQEEILDSIDLSGLGKKCIDYSEYQDGDDLKVREAFLAIENEICELKGGNNTNDGSGCGDGNINLSKLDLKCLSEDPCNNLYLSINGVLQALINKVCELEEKIKILESQ